MKRLIPIVGLSLVFLLSGCQVEDETEEPKAPQAPSNLRIEATGADSDSIKLSWDASPTEDIGGYVITLDEHNTEVELGRDTVTSFTHKPTALGTYRVRAYKEFAVSPYEMQSGAISASTELVIRENQGPVWQFDAPSDIGFSAYGWDEETGIGRLYSFSSSDPDNRPFIDFWMDTLTPAKGTDKIFSPRDFGDVWVEARETWFYTTTEAGEYGFDNVTTAPGPGVWYNFAELTTDRVYILDLYTGHYVKILVTDRKIDGFHNFTFKYGFQPVKEFRRLGDDDPVVAKR